MVNRIVWGIIFLIALAVYVIAFIPMLIIFFVTGKKYLRVYEEGVMFPIMDNLFKEKRLWKKKMKGVAEIVPRSLTRMLMALGGVIRRINHALAINFAKNIN